MDFSVVIERGGGGVGGVGGGNGQILRGEPQAQLLPLGQGVKIICEIILKKKVIHCSWLFRMTPISKVNCKRIRTVLASGAARLSLRRYG